LADRNSHVKDLFDSSIKLTDENNILHSYKPTAILLISRYSDAVVVIKREANDYIQFNDDHFSISKELTISKMADLMDTCGHILVFYHQVWSNTVHETFIDFSPNYSHKYLIFLLVCMILDIFTQENDHI
jgi:hypothetical protein